MVGLECVAGCQKLSSVGIGCEPDPGCADLEREKGDMYENAGKTCPQLRGECGELNGELSHPGLERDESNDDKRGSLHAERPWLKGPYVSAKIRS